MAQREEAEARFDRVVVDTFYEDIQAGRPDPESLREEQIALPSADDGYSRVLFVGTTGAGKTSLLRQLIGSDPEEDRFPSTAPAKTTIADIEVIQKEGNFEAAVTFFTEFQTRVNIEECITDASWAAYRGMPRDKIAERLLNHRDQKFRLSYVLGAWRTRDSDYASQEFNFDDEPTSKSLKSTDSSAVDQAELQERLERFIERVEALSESALETLNRDIDLASESARAGDRQAAEELIEESFVDYVGYEPEFHELVHDLLDAVRERFDAIETGELSYHSTGWPRLWRFSTPNRDDFIKQIRWFSSNHWTEFGKLLTPIVQGLRVRGPLFPKFLDRATNLVLIDGQGLGHTPDSSSSVTTNVTRRFPSVDIILLVDNAQQPMQAAPLSVLRTVGASGYQDKLAIGFTHFDQIKGTNLKTLDDKRAHVSASVHNALGNLQETLGDQVVRSIASEIDARTFMLGGVDRRLSSVNKSAAEYMVGELTRLVRLCERAIEPPPEPEAAPVYDPSGIGFAVRNAVQAFQEEWENRLEGSRREHWTRVKALNRRIADELALEYDTLRPVADLVTLLTESISRFLAEPVAWTQEPEDDEDREAAIRRIRRQVWESLNEVALRRLVQDELDSWRTAYRFAGPGSTFRRARTIRCIYEAAAPIPDAVMQPPSKAFLRETRELVTSAIEDAGGEVRLVESA